jgi:hypothetical protein
VFFIRIEEFPPVGVAHAPDGLLVLANRKMTITIRGVIQDAGGNLSSVARAGERDVAFDTLAEHRSLKTRQPT